MVQRVVSLTPEPLNEFLDRVQPLLEQSDQGGIWHSIGSFKWQIEHDDELERIGKLQSRLAVERRLKVRESARWNAYDRVASHRIAKARLTQVRAVYRGAKFGQELEIEDVDEKRIQSETLRELNDLWREIVIRHQATV